MTGPSNEQRIPFVMELASLPASLAGGLSAFSRCHGRLAWCCRTLTSCSCLSSPFRSSPFAFSSYLLSQRRAENEMGRQSRGSIPVGGHRGLGAGVSSLTLVAFNEGRHRNAWRIAALVAVDSSLDSGFELLGHVQVLGLHNVALLGGNKYSDVTAHPAKEGSHPRTFRMIPRVAATASAGRGQEWRN